MIRLEETTDHASVAAVIEAAFGQPEEARLVEALRHSAEPFISLVYEADGSVIGHIFFSPITLESAPANRTAMGLAPMAVLPGHQNQGIGSQLVNAGLDRCRELGFSLVFVVGHPEYYPRFGFVPGVSKGFRCEFAVRDEVFMVAELEPGAADGKSGMIKYMKEFSAL